MSLVTDSIERLIPYQAGKPIEELARELGVENPIKLASNENPLGPSQQAIAARRRWKRLARYLRRCTDTPMAQDTPCANRLRIGMVCHSRRSCTGTDRTSS